MAQTDQPQWRAYTAVDTSQHTESSAPPPTINNNDNDTSSTQNKDANSPHHSPTPPPSPHTSAQPAPSGPQITLNGSGPADTTWQPKVKYPWLVPHMAEHQKHAWYTNSLDMGSRQVKDDWGFHSASASRSHSPSPNVGAGH